MTTGGDCHIYLAQCHEDVADFFTHIWQCKIRVGNGSVSLYVNGSPTQEHALAEQIEVRTSIHLPLDALELIDFALRLSVAILGR